MPSTKPVATSEYFKCKDELIRRYVLSVRPYFFGVFISSMKSLFCGLFIKQNVMQNCQDVDFEMGKKEKHTERVVITNLKI